MSIRAQRYTFHCRFNSEALLPGYLGSTLRGALGWALKKTSCALRRQSCEGCLLREQCAYSWIFETERYRAGDRRKVNARPHPFVLQPGASREKMEAGDAFSFSLLLIERANDLLPQLVYAVRQMGESGIGSGRRRGMGRFELLEVASGDELCYVSGEDLLFRPAMMNKLSLGGEDDSVPRSLRISFVTPLRMKRGNSLQDSLPFSELIRASLRRVASLEEAYGVGEPELDYRGLIERAGAVEISTSSLHWQRLFRWSNRQKKKVSLAGLGGEVSYRGQLGEFLPLLRYASRVNIGKQTVFGLGNFHIEELES